MVIHLGDGLLRRDEAAGAVTREPVARRASTTTRVARSSLHPAGEPHRLGLQYSMRASESGQDGVAVVARADANDRALNDITIRAAAPQ